MSTTMDQTGSLLIRNPSQPWQKHTQGVFQPQAFYESLVPAAMACTWGFADCLFPVNVSYPSFQEAMQAGRYGHIHGGITPDLFGVKGEISVNKDLLLYYPYHRPNLSEEIIDELACLGLIPAGVLALLAFGHQFPSIQSMIRIVALGNISSRENGHMDVPLIGYWRYERWLRLKSWHENWSRDKVHECAFLAARKVD